MKSVMTLLMPGAALSAILGTGTFLTLTLVGDHKVKAVIMGCVGVAAGVAYGVILFCTQRPNRLEPATYRSVVVRLGPFTWTREQRRTTVRKPRPPPASR